MTDPTPEQVWDEACKYVVAQCRTMGPGVALAKAAHPSRYNPYRKKETVSLDIRTVQRKPFDVHAVRVTPENIEEVAKWCGGVLETEDDKTKIVVEVANAIRERQKHAFVGDWVLKHYGNKGYKVYTNSSFTRTFEEKSNVVEMEGRR